MSDPVEPVPETTARPPRDELAEGTACWLAGHHSYDWDELNDEDKTEFRDYARDLLRFVREPLSELSVPATGGTPQEPTEDPP